MVERVQNFRDLKIWQLGRTLVHQMYKITGTFPADERFGLVAQMRRAAVSVPSNIAEGFTRRHNKEYKQFLYIAMGSSAELETQITLAHDLGFVDKQECAALHETCNHLSRMMQSLINKL
jgi:four helix bundle protein